jgi:hypothetical protein
MDEGEPRVRRRGFFLHSDTTGEADHGEQENPEGFVVRVRIARPAVPRQMAASSGRSRLQARAAHEGNPQIRSGSVTGSRQRAHWPR